MVKVLKAGFYTTIQDSGRLGYAQYGVPISGAMDSFSANLANTILGNSSDCAVLEITMLGPMLTFSNKTHICITGAQLSPRLNNMLIQLNKVYEISKNDVLEFGKLLSGYRCYLAVSGGFNTEKVLHSRSMYANITTSATIKNDDVLPILKPSEKFLKPHARIKVDINQFSSKVIDVFKGADFEMLTEIQKEKLLTSEFTISNNNNRMAYQLVETLQNNLKPIITSLVLPGTVQLTPSGVLIILMRDCQTTGGYPRVLQLNETSINQIAQKITGSKITFRVVNF